MYMEQFEVSVEVSQMPSLEIKGFEDLENQVKELVESMKEVEVTEDNIKGSKKLVASVKAQYDVLDTRRKQVKNELLKPYEELNTQLKLLKEKLDEGDTAVRDQIRQLEQKAKEARKLVLADEFEKWLPYYELPVGIVFDSVLESQWLNKSVSEKRSIEALRTKLEKMANDLNFIDTMIEDLEEKAQAKAEWMNNGYNAQLAIKGWKERSKQVEELLKQEQEKNDKPKISIAPTQLKKKPSEEFKRFLVYGSEDSHEVVKFMLDNNIQFKQI